jgi:hypothetical protein
MNLLSRLLGRSSIPAIYENPDIGGLPAVMLNADPDVDNHHSVEVVGESEYQEALWHAVGSREAVERREDHVEARLAWEHDHPSEPWAIAVYVPTPDGYERAGYLRREMGRDYHPDFQAMRKQGYYAGACDAVIVGGFGAGDGHVTSLGIWVDLAPPGKLVSAE